MIYISHVLPDVFRLCDEMIVLRDGEVVGAGRKEEFTTERLITMMVGRSLDQLYPTATHTPAPETVMQVSDLSQPGVIEDINFDLRRGEVLGIAGLMGAGRTELARILFGLDPCASGSITINGEEVSALSTRRTHSRGMAFLTENRREEGLMMDAAISDNIALTALPEFTSGALIERQKMDAAVNQMAASVQIKGGGKFTQPVRNLSGGNQQKVVLAKWLIRNPVVLILDEPTRGVDVGARSEIYRIVHQLAEQGAGILFISSEIEELIGVCDRMLVMKRGAIAARFDRSEFSREKILSAALQSGEKLVIEKTRTIYRESLLALCRAVDVHRRADSFQLALATFFRGEQLPQHSDSIGLHRHRCDWDDLCFADRRNRFVRRVCDVCFRRRRRKNGAGRTTVVAGLRGDFADWDVWLEPSTRFASPG